MQIKGSTCAIFGTHQQTWLTVWKQVALPFANLVWTVQKSW